MKNQRRMARALAFQTLFELEARPDRATEEVLTDRAQMLHEETKQRLAVSAIDFAAQLVRGTIAERPNLDDRIASAAPAFPVDQMAATDRVALELAVFELLCEHDAPVKVIINEAVELAKTYGGENSGRFVNGVLGTIAGEIAS